VITRISATDLTSQHYPNGPEYLAGHLGIHVERSPLSGVEGWCVRGERTVIRINSSSHVYRQRFALAHELAHLVLGTEPDIASEPFRSDNREEQAADQLASEFLIPSDELVRHLRGGLPINAKILERLGRAANVSPVMAACRVVSSTEQLGLRNAAVVFFVGGREQWRYSQGLWFSEQDAEQLLQESLRIKPNLVRAPNSDGSIVVGSIIDTLVYQVLLIQLLPEETASQETRDERLSQLAADIFGADHSFRQSVATCMGVVKKKYHGASLEEAFHWFVRDYVGTKYTGGKERILNSTKGQEYLRLYLERWFG
jgi:hypothetical protein